MASKYLYNPKNGKLVLRSTNGKRGYSAVTSDQLQDGWVAALSNANTELRGGIQRLRNMARDLERSNPYVVRFLNEWVTNIVGSGYTFQSLATNSSGREDQGARQLIEEAWEEWKKPRNCSSSKDMSYCELKALTERSVARDGGDIKFKDFKDGKVIVELQGSCSGCPSSTLTLKKGVQNLLCHYVPEVKEVEAV